MAARPSSSAPPACPYRMSDGEPCGRPIYCAPAGIHEEPVCVMHSRDPSKDSDEFQKEIHAILEGKWSHHRGENRFHFRGFVFTQDANFFGATFTQDADFFGATFTQDANFFEATFTQDANFLHAKFTQDADFSGATFTQDANFLQATFTQDANFLHAKFTQDANFLHAKFTQDADFSGATFTQKANFCRATFTQKANFCRATFTQKANLFWATFTQDADFSGTTFTQDADFSGATFKQVTHFARVRFIGVVDFRNTIFERPAEVLFHAVNRENVQGMRARFLNCLLEGVRFEDVNWYRERGRVVLQDELDLRSGEQVWPRRTPELVADAYRRLVNNFEKARRYELAEECVVGEMEMRRVDPRNFPLARWSKVGEFYRKHHWARWLCGCVSVTYLYRLLSRYGSSYTRALAWLFGFVFLLFPLLFASFGLRSGEYSPGEPARAESSRSSVPTPPISWSHALRAKPRGRELWQTYKAAMWASVEASSFQRQLTFEPSDTRGHRTAVIEGIVIPGQLALLLLALRRRFRR